MKQYQTTNAGGFGGISFGLPEIAVDWEGIEEAKSDFEKTVEQQKLDNATGSGSGFTRLQNDNASRLNRLTLAGSSIGFVVGVGFAIKNKTGFWKGFGYTILGSITGASLTRGVGFLTTKN